MILAMLLLLLASLLASGILFTHRRVLTFIAVGGVLWEAQWLLLTLFDRTLARSVPTSAVFLIGSIALLIVWSAGYRRWKMPDAAGQSGWFRDGLVTVLLVIVLGASWLVLASNGFVAGEWVTHGFYNGDTVTFGALVQRSLLTDGLVRENPFAGGGRLEYPTLLHAGMATALRGFGFSEGDSWLYLLPVLVLLQIIMTVPIFFLLWDVMFPEPNQSWQRWLGVRSRKIILATQAMLVFYVLAVSWDNYIYPQSHFFLTGLFVLLMALLVRGQRESAWQEYLWTVPAAAIALVLMLSNAVTGTAAVAVISVFYLWRASDKTRPIWQRVDYLIGVAIWVVLFLVFTPGEASMGWPHFSYTAALSMTRLAPVLVGLVIAIWWQLDKYRFEGSAVAALLGLSFVTFFFSQRAIVVDNAERFIYHALLVGFPLLLPPLVQSYYWLKRALVLSSRDLGQRLTGWAGAAVVLLLLILPALASGASAHDNLMRKDRQIINRDMVEALDWIAANVEPSAVFVIAPEPPFAIPFLTGRSQLRADYWLSPRDATLDYVTKAFNGDKASQDLVLREADYLVLTGVQRSLWTISNNEKIFTNTTVSIYRHTN